MQFSQRLDLKQSQNLLMSPQLQQAIKLLQMNNLELSEFLQEQFYDNPTLDIVMDTGEKQKEDQNDSDGNNSVEQYETLNNSELSYENNFSDHASDKLSSVSQSDFQNTSNYKNLNGGDAFEDNDQTLNVSQALDLRKHLSDQLFFSKVSQKTMMIGSYLIGLVSDTGYLHESLSEIAAELMEPLSEVEKAFKLCKTFEPTGVFARTLAECLELQLREKKIYNRKYETLLANLEDLGACRYSSLLKKLDVTKDELAEMVQTIKSLHPKPGLQYSDEPIMPTIPDVFIRQTEQGGWYVELNHATMPRAIVNQTYSMYVDRKDDKLDKNTKRYLKDSVSQASWLIKSLEQRSDTILRVASEILRQQDGFFAYGFEHLKPMNLKIVAEELELHESTVSRVTSGKYLRCPRGIFEMKFFFMSGITGSDGEASVASQSVKYEIKKMIDAEDPKSILSDDDLVVMLKEKDISIARRTVAKYRESMDIPSSVKRRRQKNNFL